MSEKDTTGSAVLRLWEGDAVGECPECGLVWRDAVDFRFPQPAQCNECGSELTRATVVDEDREVAL